MGLTASPHAHAMATSDVSVLLVVVLRQETASLWKSIAAIAAKELEKKGESLDLEAVLISLLQPEAI